MKEYILGYSVKEMNSDMSSWDDKNRRTFLLTEDVTKVFSVDEGVWDSLFRIHAVDGIVQPHGWRYGTSSNLAEILEVMDNLTTVKGRFSVIAITQFLDPVTAARKGFHALPVVPDQIDHEWRFLGYDIASEETISGLSSFGYDESDIDLARDYFGSRLNKNHLFDNYEDALDFHCWNDTRDRVHGPFYVHGLYLVKEISL